jgi:acetyl esterase/lipase
MDATPTALLKLLLPKTPFLLKTAALHSLNFSPTSSKWDLKTELTVHTLRNMLGPDSKTSSITAAQKLTTKDPGIKGPMWVSKVSVGLEGRGDASRQAVLDAVSSMSSSSGTETWPEPEARVLEAEWTGYRKDATPKTRSPADLSEAQLYANLMQDTTSKVTILYFHGGAMYLLDPATYRPTAARLARQTGGRVFNVRYRLAPQNPFPAALLDAFTSYLALLYPPPGAPHTPVPANEIVFSGDSAGGMLCASLLQLLLQLHRSSANGSVPTTEWYGKEVAVPLPAGLALTSPWLDVSRALPSIEANAQYDYLPPPSVMQHMTPPPCPAWPTDPPRAEIYCEASALLHPLVSPLMAGDWTNAPPVFFSLGEEMLRDEDAVLARRMHAQGVRVRWREFEAMPHVFGMMLDGSKASDAHFDETARFCKEAVEGSVGESDGVFVLAKTLERREVDLKTVTAITDEEVERLTRGAKERIEKKHGEVVGETKPML